MQVVAYDTYSDNLGTVALRFSGQERAQEVVLAWSDHWEAIASSPAQMGVQLNGHVDGWPLER